MRSGEEQRFALWAVFPNPPNVSKKLVKLYEDRLWEKHLTAPALLLGQDNE